MTAFLPRAAFVVALSLLAEPAGAQSRQFDCGDDGVLTLKVIDARTVSAGPIGGKTFALKQDAREKLRFRSGRIVVEIARDQKRVRVAAPDRDFFDCVFRGPGGAKTRAADAGKVVAPVAKPKRRAGDLATAEPESAAEPDRVTPPVVKPRTKRPTAAGKTFAAKSWGGIVRAGPGQEFPKLASLAEGDPISVIEATDVIFNDFPWFKISYDDGKTGYQWGGIICPVGKEVAGAFQSCD